MRLLFANGLFWLSVACCLIAQLYIIRSVRGARHVPAPAAGLPRHRGALELLWAVVPAIGLVVLLVFTWRAIQETTSPSSAPARSGRTVPA
jgi:heme/copper-type cytochrome/quinol oxidase subunit 2